MTFLERFWWRVDSSGDCWIWTRAANNSGYGLFASRGTRTMSVHRFSWELANGSEIPAGMMVLHNCDVRRCVRPDHLRLGTHQDNMQDKVERNIQRERREHPRRMDRLVPQNPPAWGIGEPA